MKTQDLINQIAECGTITEKQINLITRRLNNGEEMNLEPISYSWIELTPEQTAKGLKWLKSVIYTPTGKLRQTAHPFGSREVEIIDNFDSFTLDCFHYVNNRFIVAYNVHDKNRDTFTYYFSGKINICG